MIKRNTAILSVLSLAIVAAALSASSNAFVMKVSAQSTLDPQSIIASIQEKLSGATTGTTTGTGQIQSIISQLKSLESQCTPSAAEIQSIITAVKDLQTQGSSSANIQPI